VRTIFAIAIADLRERTRRPGFLLTLVLSVVAASYFLPPSDAGYATLQIGGNHRGLYNSAYVGVLIAILDAAFLSFAGFFLVKNAVDRDRITRVGAILAATPITRARYALGKFASNLTVLATILLCTGIAGGFMQRVRAEDTAIHPWALLAPLLLVTLPVLALVAALAVLFDMIPWLRGGFGNVVFFFSWTAMMAASSFSNGSHYDLVGESVVMNDVFTACTAAFPQDSIQAGNYSLGIAIKDQGERWKLSTFRYGGMKWRWDRVASRIGWFTLAIVVALFAALVFDRFESVGGGAPRAAGSRAPPAGDTAVPATHATNGRHASSLSPVRTGFRFGALVVAELRLAFNGVSKAWALVALGLTIASLFAPLTVVRQVLTPIAWIWPLMLWSALGTRESRFGTSPVLFSSPRPLTRQLPAIWIAGLAISVVTGGGLGLRFLLGGDLAAFATWLAGAAFIPALALALGVWSGSGKFFEVIYLLLWYAGPLNRVPTLDYMAATPEGVAQGVGVGFGIVAIASLALAFAGRRRQALA